MKNKLPFVSIIIPCRNEQKYIYKCLDSIVQNNYPKDKLEVLVLDGMSQDKTRKIIKGFASKYSFVKLLNNYQKIVPTALNKGIKSAKGKIIIRIDAHAWAAKDFILQNRSF